MTPHFSDRFLLIFTFFGTFIPAKSHFFVIWECECDFLVLGVLHFQQKNQKEETCSGCP
jgi:hypothetical protein